MTVPYNVYVLSARNSIVNRPSAKTLWQLALTLLVLALLDVLLTSVGLFFFYGKEGNPLIITLAQWIPYGSDNKRVVTAVWLLKMPVIAGVLLAVHAAVKSKPARDDWLMFYGLAISLIVYTGVIASWVWYFALITTGLS